MPPITSAFKQNEFGNPLQGASDYVKLPLPALRLRWHNGSRSTKTSAAFPPIPLRGKTSAEKG